MIKTIFKNEHWDIDIYFKSNQLTIGIEWDIGDGGDVYFITFLCFGLTIWRFYDE